MNAGRYRKKELLTRLSTLEKLNDSIRVVLGKSQAKNRPKIMDLLMQCQELAIDIGTGLEAWDESSEDAVRILEDYCENLYQMSVSLPDEMLCRKLSKKAVSQLVKAENIIRFQLPDDKKEAVFLPYKASMWDSLESVWKAMKDDEGWNVFVVPIPYYDKNQDGSLGLMHYDADEYPDDVPVVSWKTYDIASRRPDLIFIHNPYDDENYVTSVHPDFYAEKLVNYTDRLIYIPYFILPEIDPDDQRAIEGMKKFCFLPGVLYADHVIVQSEAMRRIYIKEFLKEAQGNDWQIDKKQIEHKFLGLGSPKIDRVADTQTELSALPQSWLEVMVKPDKSLKKIILYNTSIAALLKYKENMLEKMEKVFQACKENKEEIALLWRPHPLIPSTIKTMRPSLWKAYSDIVRRYRCEAWGIYDDTSDMDRAIAVSDAYYGDPSSVAELYQLTGKPVIIQSIDPL